jgi:hypothetical protein
LQGRRDAAAAAPGKSLTALLLLPPLLLLLLLFMLQVVVERLMAFLRSTACGGDEMLRRHIAGQIVDLAEKYAPDTTSFVGVIAKVR